MTGKEAGIMNTGRGAFGRIEAVSYTHLTLPTIRLG